MNTIKETLQIAEHYPDNRVHGLLPGHPRVRQGLRGSLQPQPGGGVRYVRGLPGSVEEDPETTELIVHVENTSTGELAEIGSTWWCSPWDWFPSRARAATRQGNGSAASIRC